MVKLSIQQQCIVDYPLDPMCVMACAGSGKTRTAVERLAKIRGELGDSRSHVALLSFSNIAVNTFERIYSEKQGPHINNRVTIDTFDSFITSNILRPHAYRTMGCDRVPFLLNGSEPFLQNKQLKYWYEPTSTSKRPVEGVGINDIVVRINDKGFDFRYRFGKKEYLTNNGLEVTKSLGRFGAYTHELGKFWALLTLACQPEILRVLANRYPHIIVDEAQDVGELHQAILELLIEQGVKVTLIGDPNQSIYEFAGAAGEFMVSFNGNPDIKSFDLSTNYRSIPEILRVANAVSGRSDKSDIISDNSCHGAYYKVYDPKQIRQLVKFFEGRVGQSDLSVTDSAVLCRGNAGVEKIHMDSECVGQGRIKLLALAAIHRGKSEYQKAFKLLVICIVSLLDDAPDDLGPMLLNSSRYPEVRGMCQDLWLFLRSINDGLPSAFLEGSTTWHPLVKERLIRLLDTIEEKYGYSKTSNIGNKLSRKRLTEEPLMLDPELALGENLTIRVDTVHQAKGESLDSVLYIANKSHIDKLLNGVGTEVGRIGYVAVTRAKKLFVLGVPKSAAKELVPKLHEIGLKELK
ncbi:ATP-dependent helicase [Marinimicrobium agarilyticum]|uniref:ATP-dependent helicase n=1 Tax=Marinimicrobium agarilyticum TaxID=306546 RepID=UPI00041ED42A|nr:ATP-dependent helicase [Marinimicrobium agarilyticum]